jgi:putative membrane protein
LENKRGDLIDNLGGCERILKTPMPFMMAVKARRFILFFLLMLPFALVNTSNALTPIISGIVSYALLALDQIAVEMQRPFFTDSISHLPLEQVTETISKNINTLKNLDF